MCDKGGNLADQPKASSSAGTQPTPAARLQWWRDFDYPVYEIATLVPVLDPELVTLFPADRQKAFQSAMGTLQNVAAQLHNTIKHDVIAALEKTPPEEPTVPNIALPDVPPWNPGEPNTVSKFKQILYAMIPFVQDLAERLGKDSNIGLAVLELFSAADAVADQLNSVTAPAST
jgi:hypothetical protein